MQILKEQINVFVFQSNKIEHKIGATVHLFLKHYSLHQSYNLHISSIVL